MDVFVVKYSSPEVGVIVARGLYGEQQDGQEQADMIGFHI